MRKLVTLLIAFLLLAACSEQETPSEDVSKKDIMEHIINEVDNGAGEIDSDTDVEPVVEPMQENQDKETILQAYMDQIYWPVQNIGTNIQTIQMLCQLGANDPGVLLTPTYFDTVQATAEDLRNNIAKIRAAEVGNDPELQDVHDRLLQAVEELEFIANNFPIGVKEMDADVIIQCNDALDRSTQYVKEATNLLTNYKNKYGL